MKLIVLSNRKKKLEKVRLGLSYNIIILNIVYENIKLSRDNNEKHQPSFEKHYEEKFDLNATVVV